jgi:RND superfamily putative drug exporter
VGNEAARARRVKRGTRWERVGAFVARRPRRVVAAWLLVVVVLSAAGVGLESNLSTRPVVVDGSAAEHEREIILREFGGENAVVVMLSGPSRQVVSQGHRLEDQIRQIPESVVLSPWAAGASIAGLRPRPQVAALVVNVKGGPDEGLLDILPVVRHRIDETVEAPVHVSIAGAPAIVDSIHKSSERAAELGQWIAFPALLVILLLVFRSVFAAATPIVVGGSVVAASRGVLDLLTNVMHIDVLALAVMGMMGLALGVDYSLLVVSRFREELGAGADVSEAVQGTVVANGRTVLMAGSGLCLAMLVASQLLRGDIVYSAAIAVAIASVLSVLAAIFVAPALLALLGTRLDRWSLPRREASQSWASRWAGRLSSRPAVAVPVVLLILVLAAAWAPKLDTGIGTVALLPEGDSGRRQQEEVQRALGPGWVAPLEIVMAAQEGTVTTPERLRALADFQRRLEDDPGVATMTGFAGFARASRQLSGFGRSLAREQRGLDRLGVGLGQARRGASLNTDGLLAAASGAANLNSALAATQGGAGALAEGIGAASSGSQQLAGGLGRASDSSSEIAGGTADASAGAGRLSEELLRARGQTGEIERTAASLESTMRSGEERLSSEVEAPVTSAEDRLAAARESLRQMTTGREDPQYAAALEAVEAASVWLTGVDPNTGEESGSTDGALAGVRSTRGQFSLGLYLAQRLSATGEKASDGMEKLAKSSAKLDSGLERLSGGTRQMQEGIARLASSGRELPPGLSKLEEGAERLTGGLGQISSGAGGLAQGLGGGAQKSKLLGGALRKMQAGIERGAGGEQLDDLQQRSPGLFHSGFFFLASLDGSKPAKRRELGFLVSIDQGGQAARMLVIPRYDPSDPRARETRDRLEGDADRVARETGTEVVVGGVTASQLDVDAMLRDRTPGARLALALVTLLILVLLLRSLLVPILAALLNVLTVAATFGFLALLFDGSLLGGPGYVDAVVIPGTMMIIFGLAIDYEVFIFARMREEYLRTGSSKTAVDAGLAQTAPVVTGAAIVMIVVFLSFAVSSFATMRNFGTAQAIGVAIDAFLVRLILVPAVMRLLGRWAWWMPAWLDRLLPGTPNKVVGTSASGAESR